MSRVAQNKAADKPQAPGALADLLEQLLREIAEAAHRAEVTLFADEEPLDLRECLSKLHTLRGAVARMGLLADIGLVRAGGRYALMGGDALAWMTEASTKAAAEKVPA